MGIVSSIYGVDEFIYLLNVCLRNYGSVISTGIYQEATTIQSAIPRHAEPQTDDVPAGNNNSEKIDPPTSIKQKHDRGRNENRAGDVYHDMRNDQSATNEMTASHAEQSAAPTNTQQNNPPKRLKVHKEKGSSSEKKEEQEPQDQQLRDTIRGLKVDIDDAVLEFSDVAGLETVKCALEEFACFFLHFPHLTRNLRQRSTTGILLFGPQGTGKTLLVKSFAKKFNLSFYDVRASSIMSKYVGESEKFIKALFQEIRRNAPAILMLDECDGLLCNPASDMTQSHNYRLLQNELKNQWSDLIYSRDEVIVIGATNKPHDIDFDGFGRRLTLKLYVDLPNETACQAILKTALSRVRHTIDDDDLQTLGLLCHEKHLSGYDIDCLVEAQLRRGIRSITTASHFRRIEWENETILVPCSQDDADAIPGPWTKVTRESEELSYHPFRFGEIHGAVLRVRATVDEAMRQRHLSFASQYGTDN